MVVRKSTIVFVFIFTFVLIIRQCHCQDNYASVKEVDINFKIPSEAESSTIKDHGSMVVCSILVEEARNSKEAKYDALALKYNFRGDLCTHLRLHFIYLTETFDIQIVQDADEIKKFRQIKLTYSHLKLLVVATIADVEKNMKAIVPSKANRQKFITRLKDIVRQLYVDGIILTHRVYYYSPSEFIDFSTELKNEFKKENLLTGIELHLDWSPRFHDFPNIAKVSRIYDFVFLRGYSFNTRNNIVNFPHHFSPLYSNTTDNIYDAVKSLLTKWQINRHNFVLEIASFGSAGLLQNCSYENNFPFTCQANNSAVIKPAITRRFDWIYPEICSTVLRNENDWKSYWDDTGKVPFLINKKTDTFFSYDNIDSVMKKTELAVKLGLGGVDIRVVNYDDPLKKCSNISYPFLKVVNFALSKYKHENGSMLCSILSNDNNSPIKFKPLVTLISNNVTVVQGEMIEVNCTAEGSSPLEVNWVKMERNLPTNIHNSSNVEVSTTKLKVECSIDKTLTTLKIKNVDTKENYHCQATNSEGSNMETLFIQIANKTFDSSKLLPSQPVWTTSFIILIAVSVIATMSLILLFSYFIRHKKSKGGLTKEEVAYFRSGSVTLDSGYNSIPDNLPYESQFEIAKDDYIVDKTKILGMGAFGIVYKGQVKDVPAAVKTTKPGSGKQSTKSLLSELKMLIYVEKHPYIVNLIGAVTTGLNRGILYVFVEWCPLGSLQGYLRKSRKSFVNSSTEGLDLAEYEALNCYKTIQALGDFQLIPKLCRCEEENEVTLKHLFTWSSQIAKGLLYLSSKNLIHGDMATRNVLLFCKNLAKITDFGLSRKLYEYTTYMKKNQEPLPWRWMAIESLRDMEFSVQSDIWSFGVTIWEIFTFAETPYGGLPWTIDFVEKLKHTRLPKPQYAPESIYSIMTDCWNCDPKERCKPDEIVTLLDDIINEHYEINK